MAAVLGRTSRRLFRHSRLDAWLVGLSLVHATVLLVIPSVPVIALGLWWNANTIAHNFIHLPFFRSRALNRIYSAYLTLVLGFPQSLWRRRHLSHHAGYALIQPLSIGGWLEVALVVTLWGTLAAISPLAFFGIYLPGWAIGLLLCQLQGYYEHARGTTSHYGRLYNALFFNDGYHIEHHARPSMHWSRLAWHPRDDTSASRWPPVFRWLDAIGLNGLERLVLASGVLQRFVIDRHERAFRKLLHEIGKVETVTIVGGGMFPRTAI